MPLQRRLPKQGFKNIFRKAYFGVNLGKIGEKFTEGDVTVADLQRAGLVPRKCVDIRCWAGDFSAKLNIKAPAFLRAPLQRSKARAALP